MRSRSASAVGDDAQVGRGAGALAADLGHEFEEGATHGFDVTPFSQDLKLGQMGGRDAHGGVGHHFEDLVRTGQRPLCCPARRP